MPPAEALLAGLALAALAGLLGAVLLLAGRWLESAGEARTEAVVALLPGVNCGSCGQPGCRAFAAALLRGAAQPAQCSVSPPDGLARLAAFLKVDVGQVQRRVARLACAGDRSQSRRQADYPLPAPGCAEAVQLGGGDTACAWACLGLGDCERACDFDAIAMVGGLPRVDEAACTACGDCVRACPRDLFHLVPQAQPLWVACSNPLAGTALLQDCRVACTACGRCVQDAPDWLELKDNLPRLLALASGPAPREAIERCPTGAIVWFEQGQPHRGALALQPAPTHAPHPAHGAQR